MNSLKDHLSIYASDSENGSMFSPNRYNNYDRSVINTIPHDVVQRWYEAHRVLTTELRRPENELWVKLTPGKVRLGYTPL